MSQEQKTQKRKSEREDEFFSTLLFPPEYGPKRRVDAVLLYFSSQRIPKLADKERATGPTLGFISVCL